MTDALREAALAEPSETCTQTSDVEPTSTERRGGGMISRIHVNQHVIRANHKTGADDPVFTVKQRGRTIIAREVEVLGPSRLVYQPDKPLSCGAKVWIETTAEITIRE